MSNKNDKALPRDVLVTAHELASLPEGQRAYYGGIIRSAAELHRAGGIDSLIWKKTRGRRYQEYEASLKRAQQEWREEE